MQRGKLAGLRDLEDHTATDAAVAVVVSSLSGCAIEVPVGCLDESSVGGLGSIARSSLWAEVMEGSQIARGSNLQDRAFAETLRPAASDGCAVEVSIRSQQQATLGSFAIAAVGWIAKAVECRQFARRGNFESSTGARRVDTAFECCAVEIAVGRERETPVRILPIGAVVVRAKTVDWAHLAAGRDFKHSATQHGVHIFAIDNIRSATCRNAVEIAVEPLG